MPGHAFTRLLLRAVLLSIGCWPILADKAQADKHPVHPMEWRVLRVGGGGFLTGIDVSPDGLVKVVRADTYGAYLWSQARQQWTQLVTASSMPPGDVGVDKDTGVYEIRVAPSLTSRLYMAYNGFVYRSDDGGARWNRTAFPRSALSANDSFRTFGQKMAVDPANPDIVYAGAPRSGLFGTSDGGKTWRQVADIPRSVAAPNGEIPGIVGIAFDGHSGLVAGRTRTIYASSYGHGVYRSDDAGSSWTVLTGGPSNISHGKTAVDGVYYAVGDDGSAVWRSDESGWSNITPGGASSNKNVWSTIAPDPFNPARLLAVKEGSDFMVSRDRGANWDNGVNHSNGERRVATDAPWLAWTRENFMSVGDMVLDPATPDLLWFAEGIGVWRTNLPANRAESAPVAFISQTAGIEQLVANQILSPPGGKPLLASWDRPVFRIENPDVYPSVHGPDNERAIVMGWALDYAPDQPSFIAGVFDWWGVEKSGFSLDGGRSWSPFPSYPPTTINGKIGGDIAVSTPDNMVWALSNHSTPYVTRDGGASWTPVLLPYVPRDGDNGWSAAYYLNRRIVAADRVKAGTFYLYNSLNGLYRSSDGGVSWKLVSVGEIAPFSGFNAKLRAVPGHAGHLFFTSGSQGGAEDRHPAPNAFMRSVDGGATWSEVIGAREVRAFGFGKARGKYPAIFIVGWIDGDYGVWRSDNEAVSWTKIGEFPLGIMDHVTAIEGDGDIAGRVYIGFGGAGYVYGVERP